jgi:rubrerythrin
MEITQQALRRPSRRRFLLGAGIGGFAVTIGTSVVPAWRLLAPAVAQELADDDLVAFAESVELAAVEAYRAAGAGGKIKNRALADALTTFAGHHREHAVALAAVSGGKATGRPNRKLLDTVVGQLTSARDEKAVIGLAFDLENAVAATYVSALGALDSPQAMALTASILPVESQHATTLGSALAKQGEDLVPPFETKDKALDPTTFPLT